MTVQQDVGQWLDLPVPPDGLRQQTNLSLASAAVCTNTVVTDGSLTCTALEGQIESHYRPVEASLNADETENEIEIRTVYIDIDLSTYVASFEPGDASPVSVRDTDALIVTSETGTTVMWSDRPGTISRLTTKAGTLHDPVALANQLVPVAWPASLHPPIVAVGFAKTWRAFDNNHPYALATTQPGAECISVSYVPRDLTDGVSDESEHLACASPNEHAWTVGTISDHASTTDLSRADQDVFAGLVPASVALVEVTLDDGRNLNVETVAVPGLKSRAWGVPTGAPQGTIAVGQVAGFTIGGDEVFNEPLVALAPTVFLPNVCRQPGTTVIVPDIVGQDLRTAKDALHAAGLLVALKFTGDHLPIVDEQTPRAGTDIECGQVLLSFAD